MMQPQSAELDEAIALLVRGAYLTTTNRLMLERFMTRWQQSAVNAILLLHLLTEAELADAFSKLLKLPRVYALRHRRLEQAAAARLGFERARAWQCLPLLQEQGTSAHLEVVVADPTQKLRWAELERELGQQLTLSVAERSDIVAAIDELYPLSAQLPELFNKLSTERR